jgi:hypothetical protein
LADDEGCQYAVSAATSITIMVKDRAFGLYNQLRGAS